MQYFKKDFCNFFADLSANNNIEWFHAHKRRYEQAVRIPFAQFITDLITEIQRYDARLDILAKECILRINRDIRFSADKSPYKDYTTAFVSYAGKRDKTIPGIFIRFSRNRVGVMGGCFNPTTPQRAQIRTAIASHTTRFQTLYTAPPFRKTFQTIQGDSLKRIPTDPQRVAQIEPLILNKQFYYVIAQPPALITSDTIIAEMMRYWHAAKPLNDFLYQAIKRVN